MTDMIWMGLSLVALLAAFPAVILADVLPRRHRRQYQVHTPEGRMTAQGVPYVPGCERRRGSL
jgi:hypothetical protein